MKMFTLVFLMLSCVSVLPDEAFAQRRHAEHAFIILVDRGGTNIRPEESHKVLMEAFKFFRDLRRLRRFSRSHLEILDMTEGRSAWVGTPRTLSGDEVQKVMNAITIKENMCTDLQRGFETLETKVKSIERRGFTHLHIFVFSPLVHTGAPCKEPNITLPQIPPVNFDFAKALNSSNKTKTILVFNANPSQTKVWGVDGILKPLTAWDDQGPEFTFHLFDETSSFINLQTEVRRMFR